MPDEVEEVGLSKIQEASITETLKKCGINEVNTIEKLPHQAQSYKISTKDADNIFVYMNKNKVDSIAFPQATLYDKGKVLAKLSDYIMSYDKQLMIKMNSEDYVRNSLKSPSTAKFPADSEWKIWKEKKAIYVESYVDAQNSFGATIRNTFKLKIINNNVVRYRLNCKRIK